MFDQLISLQAGPPVCGPDSVLSSSVVSGWKDDLSASLDTSSGLDDGERVDAVRALEELVCAATAAQAALSAELDGSRRAADAELGVPAARRGKGVASLVAFARRESPHRGQRHLGLATVARAELPCTWAGWCAGRVTEWTATLIARETACLTLADRLAVDEIVAGDLDKLEGIGTGELVGVLRAEAARLDPAAVVRRRRKAEADRHVSVRPAPDTMTYLSALLPVADGVAVLAALTGAADSARSGGDGRGRGQVMADELVVRIAGCNANTGADMVNRTDAASATNTDAAPKSKSGAAWPTATTRAASPAARPVELGLIMTDHALFGGTDDTARLEGYGPIPAELAREIVGGAVSGEERVAIRRLYTNPDTGELVAMESTSRTFGGNLAKFIKLRDQVCRTPWCDAPIRHIDHAVPDIRGGPTSETNGQGLCEACNYAKEGSGWHARPVYARPVHARPAAGGGIETRLPTGHSYRTRPPAVATIRHVPPMRIDYALTG